MNESRQFFRLPDSIKKAYAKSNDKVNSYSGYYVSQKQTFRQRYDIRFDTKYPSEVPNFETAFVRYRYQCNRLVQYLLILIAKSFDLKDHEFLVQQHSAIFDGSSNTKSHLSAIYYNETSYADLMDEHTDFSTFTLVFTSSPGLQVVFYKQIMRLVFNNSFGPQIYHNNEWIDLDCGPNGIVFHIGDLLQRWTGNSCPATVS